MQDLMEKPWFEKHRPRTMDDVVFESSEVEKKIKDFVKEGYIRGNLISYGPGGVGKTTINKILLHSIIKNMDDYFVLGKSVTDIERLKSWLLEVSISSKQRIVVCEEFDQLSPQAQTALKNGLMENYMPNVAYIVTTNNIHNIDAALLQRFNEKLNFTSFNVDGCYFRMKTILEAENIKHDDNELYALVKTFEHKGIRELINNLQAGSIDGEFKPSNLASGVLSTSGIEEALVGYIKYYIDFIMSLYHTEIYPICTIPTSNPTIAQYYTPMLEFMEKDPSINYEFIYRSLLNDETVLLPLKLIFQKYYQELKLIPMANIHLQSCLFEVFANLYTIKGGDKKLIH
jgi:DNA polymerase III delta prime subunit